MKNIKKPFIQKCLSLLTLASGALATHDPFAQYREKRALGERNVVGKYPPYVDRDSVLKPN